jgi:hypothetical protein
VLFGHTLNDYAYWLLQIGIILWKSGKPNVGIDRYPVNVDGDR